MGVADKMQAAGEKLVGKAKEAAGKVSDNEKLEAEGQAEQLKGEARETVEDVKDFFKE